MHILQEGHCFFSSFFTECPLVKNLWYETKKWLHEILGKHADFDKYSTIFAKFENMNIHKIET